jgi:hypothetical protein
VLAFICRQKEAKIQNVYYKDSHELKKMPKIQGRTTAIQVRIIAV